MPRLAVIFDCDHRATSPLVLENLRRTIALFGERAEVISVFHSDSAPPPLPGRVLHLTSADIFDAFAHRKARTIIPGNEDLKLIAAAQRLPEFTHFIHHEYDVWHNNPEPELVDRLCEAAIGGTFGASWIRPTPTGCGGRALSPLRMSLPFPWQQCFRSASSLPRSSMPIATT